jgi:hypothetical protein
MSIVLVLTGGTGQIATIGTAFGSPIQVLVENSEGQVLSGRTVSFSIQNTANLTATFPNNQSHATAVSDANGNVKSPAITAGQSPGNINITLTCGTASQSATLVIVAVASLTIADGNNQLGYIDAQFLYPVSVNVLNSQGTPAVDGTPITFSVQPAGYATFTEASATVKVLSTGGVATSPKINCGSAYGTFSIIAAVTGLTASLTQAPSPVTFSEVIVNIPRFNISAGNNQTIHPWTDSSPLVVQALDPQSKPIPDGSTVTFTIIKQGGVVPAVFTNSKASVIVPPKGGLATSPNLTSDRTFQGAFQVTATLTYPPTGSVAVSTTFHETAQS